VQEGKCDVREASASAIITTSCGIMINLTQIFCWRQQQQQQQQEKYMVSTVTTTLFFMSYFFRERFATSSSVGGKREDRSLYLL